jgi:hypothetical protein
VSGFTSGLTDTNIYNSNGTLTGNRTVNLSASTLTFSHTANTANLVLSGGNVNIGFTGTPTNRLTVSATTDPLRIIGLSSSTDNTLITTDANGVFHTLPVSAVTNIYNSNGTLTGNRTVTLSTSTLTFSHTANTNNLVLSGGNVNIGFTGAPTNRLTVSATTDPLRIIGLTGASDNTLITTDSNGVFHTLPVSAVTNIYNSNGTLTGNRTVTLSTSTLTFSHTANTNNLVLSGGNVNIGFTGAPTNRLTVSATTDPLRIIGFQTATTDSNVLTIDSNGVIY